MKRCDRKIRSLNSSLPCFRVGSITAVLLTRRRAEGSTPFLRLFNQRLSQEAEFGLTSTLMLVVCYFSLHSVILLEVLRFNLAFVDLSAKP